MNVDYARIDHDLYDGTFRQRLQEELMVGFRQIRDSGERLPLPSHYASEIAAIVDRGAPEPLSAEAKFNLYQEILLACETATATVMGEG